MMLLITLLLGLVAMASLSPVCGVAGHTGHPGDACYKRTDHDIVATPPDLVCPPAVDTADHYKGHLPLLFPLSLLLLPH